jgi:hypothetical protein
VRIGGVLPKDPAGKIVKREIVSPAGPGAP